MRSLSACGTRVIAVDLPAHGRSDGIDSSIVYRNEHAARLILGLMDSRHIQHAAFVGYRQGKMIALYAAVLAPARVTAIATVGARRSTPRNSGPISSVLARIQARMRVVHGDDDFVPVSQA